MNNETSKYINFRYVEKTIDYIKPMFPKTSFNYFKAQPCDERNFHSSIADEYKKRGLVESKSKLWWDRWEGRSIVCPDDES